jgi:hypothetical protein
MIMILSKPLIKLDNPQVIDSQLINQNQETLTTGPLWDQDRNHIHPLFDNFRMDLRPAINNIKTILPTFLPQHNHTFTASRALRRVLTFSCCLNSLSSGSDKMISLQP